MAWAGHLAHFLVVTWSLVFVGHHESDRGTQGPPVLGTRQDGDAVLLIAGRGEGGLAWPPAGELRLDVRLRELHARRHAIDNGTYGLAVGLAKGSNTEARAKRGH